MEEFCQVVLSLASYPSLSYRLCESFSQRSDAIHGHEQMLGAEVRHTKQNLNKSYVYNKADILTVKKKGGVLCQG